MIPIYLSTSNRKKSKQIFWDLRTRKERERGRSDVDDRGEKVEEKSLDHMLKVKSLFAI